MLAVLSFATYTVLSKPLQKNHHNGEIVSFFFFVTAIIMSILNLIELFAGHTIVTQAPLTPSVLGLIISATLGTALFYMLFQRLVSRGGPLYAAFFLYISPVASSILAMIFLGEKLTSGLLAGATLTFLGVWLYGRK